MKKHKEFLDNWYVIIVIVMMILYTTIGYAFFGGSIAGY